MLSAPLVTDVRTAITFIGSPYTYGVDSVRFTAKDTGTKSIELVNLLLYILSYCFRKHAGSNLQNSCRSEILASRYIEEILRVFPDENVFTIASNANDLNIRALRSGEAELLSDGIFARPESAGDRFIDDGDARRSLIIGRCKSSSPGEGNSHGLKIKGVHCIVKGLEKFVRASGCIAVDFRSLIRIAKGC